LYFQAQEYRHLSKQIDELSKNLAGGMSRRRAFGRFAAAIGGALFLGRKASAGGNNVCVQFCRYQGLSGREFGKCVSASAHCPDGECAVVANSGQFICCPVG
jgi:hypothetical protein